MPFLLLDVFGKCIIFIAVLKVGLTVEVEDLRERGAIQRQPGLRGNSRMGAP